MIAMLDAVHGVGAAPPHTILPSLREGGGDGGPGGSGEQNRPSKYKIGLGSCLCVATVIFSIAMMAYFARRGMPDWRAAIEPRVLWFNTLLLVLASAAMQFGSVAGRRDNPSGMYQGLLAGGLCAWLFLAGQWFAWREMQAAGYGLITNPADGFFYFLTALHGLHLLGGLVAWGKTLWQRVKGRDVRQSVQLCAWYWHFLLAVWLVMFSVLLTT